LDWIKAACARRTVEGILAQKPLGMNYREALEAVKLCEDAGITLAVNQNMRYDQSVRAAKTLLRNGTIGDRCSPASRCAASRTGCRGRPRWVWVTLRINVDSPPGCFPILVWRPGAHLLQRANLTRARNSRTATAFALTFWNMQTRSAA